LKLSELAERLGCRLEGDGTIEISGISSIDRAGPGDLTFFVNPRYAAALRTTRASAVIAGKDVAEAPCAILRHDLPYVAFAHALRIFNTDPPPPPGVHPSAHVAPSARIAGSASIGAFTFVDELVQIGERTVVGSHVSIGREATIGSDCLIHSHVAVRERSIIGNRVIVQNGATVGSDGFGFTRRADGNHEKIPQTGRVVIEDDVEIGAHTAVDRPAIGETRIGAGTKVDNLVQIGHSVSIGQRVLLAAQVGIAGSTTIEDDVTLAGQVGVAGHLTIGRKVVATAQTGIPNSVEAGTMVSGYPAIENREWLRASAVFRKLPELRKTLAGLSARVIELEARLDVQTGGDASR
jgi:UDP-3-O-[3-hydroxymyristoyl] glucosamine N-acyltransferase